MSRSHRFYFLLHDNTVDVYFYLVWLLVKWKKMSSFVKEKKKKDKRLFYVTQKHNKCLNKRINSLHSDPKMKYYLGKKRTYKNFRVKFRTGKSPVGTELIGKGYNLDSPRGWVRGGRQRTQKWWIVSWTTHHPRGLQTTYVTNFLLTEKFTTEYYIVGHYVVWQRN